MPLDKDYYEILGVDRSAASAEIKSAFRRLARTYHPDVHPNSPEATLKIQAIIEAYQVLGDPARRAKHDQQLGYNRSAPQPGADPSTASAWRDTPSSPSSAPRHQATRPTEQELTRFIVRQIGRGVSQNDIIYQVCLMSDVFWAEAEALVCKLEAQQSRSVPRWIRLTEPCMIS